MCANNLKAILAPEKTLGWCWWETLEQSIKEAAKEKKTIAIEVRAINEGAPPIDVVLNGGWCKHTLT